MRTLDDRNSFAELMNQLLAEKEKINPDWIDEAESKRMTEVINHLIPPGWPFRNVIKVIRDPEWKWLAEKPEDTAKKLFYYWITVVPGAEKQYLKNYGIYHFMTLCCLSAWEQSRCILEAGKHQAVVKIVEGKEPQMINGAIIRDITLYVGKEPFDGTRSLKDHLTYEMDVEALDAQMIDLRRMEPTPVISEFLREWDENEG